MEKVKKTLYKITNKTTGSTKSVFQLLDFHVNDTTASCSHKDSEREGLLLYEIVSTRELLTRAITHCSLLHS